MDAVSHYLISRILKSKVNVIIAHLLCNEAEIWGILSDTFMFSYGYTYDTMKNSTFSLHKYTAVLIPI